MIECALTLRFLTQDHNELNQRTGDFAQFEMTDKQYWMHHALQIATDPEMQQKIYERAQQFNLEPNPRGVQKHWSGIRGFAWDVNLREHPLDNTTITELDKRSTYAVEYHSTSSFVHCYAPAVDNFLPSKGIAFEVQESSEKWHKLSQRILFILIDCLHICVAYALFGMNLERTQSMNDLFSETLQSLMPYRPISDFRPANS